MPSLDSELRTELDELSMAAKEFDAEPSEEGVELVCIRSRAVVTTFKMLCVWSDAVDQSLKDELVAVFDGAIERLSPHYENSSDQTPGRRYYQRVCERRDEARDLTVDSIRESLPAPT